MKELEELINAGNEKVRELYDKLGIMEQFSFIAELIMTDKFSELHLRKKYINNRYVDIDISERLENNLIALFGVDIYLDFRGFLYLFLKKK